MQRVGESRASTHRSWSDERFLGREGKCYIVTGKGGLRREVRIPNNLAARLEARRLEAMRIIKDRGIIYHQYYDVSGGNAWSKSFSDADARLGVVYRRPRLATCLCAGAYVRTTSAR